ncbi:MAG: hypothetical protein V3V16_15070 [Melioribacteraceae bacterium]
MKTKIKFIIVLVALIFSLTELTAQTKVRIEKPVKPAKPERFDFDFNFDFEGLKMSQKEEKKALKEMKAHLREQLATIKEHNTNTYYELLTEAKYKSIRFPFTSKREKKELEMESRIFEFEVASLALAAKYRKASTGKRQSLKTELKNILNNLFDAKEEERKSEVKELEKELSELRKSLSIRKANKNGIVKRRLQDLLDEDDYLEWE